MKRIFAIFAAVLAYTGAANAQVAAADNNNANASASIDESCYCCPKGDFCSNEPGTCALHVNINLVKDGDYYCPIEDNVTSSDAGVCPATGKKLKRMKGKCPAMNNESEKKNKKSGKDDNNEGNKKNEGNKNEDEQNPGETGK